PCAVACVGLLTLSLPAADWPQYRGPTHDAVSTERINKNWSGSVTNPIWTVCLTNGLTSLTVGGGRVFTQAAADTDGDIEGLPDTEYCLALSATNGALLWATAVDSQPFLYPDGGVGTTDDGPRSTPALWGGSVYVLSSYLQLYRLNATNGAIIWSTNLVAGFGGDVIGWQNAASPVIENGLVYVNANSPTASLMAFNATNGALIWRAQNEGLTHATPTVANVLGTRELIWATQSGLVAVNPTNGALIWKSPYPFGYTTSIGASPVVHSNYVFITANYSMSAYAVQVVQSNVTQVAVPRWTNTTQRSHWSTAVAYAGHLFGLFYPDNDDGQLRCVNLANGATRWSTNGFGRSTLLLNDTNLVCLTERGDLVLVAARTNTYLELARFQAIPDFHTDTNKCWNGLALSDGQIYVRSTAYAARYDLSVPDLKFDLPQPAGAGRFNLTLRTVTGAAVDSNRLAGLELRATNNAAAPAALWPKLTNLLTLSNGIVRATNVDASSTQKFFIVSEPK
ncbi:MAG: hypothetical protein EPO07_20010, partial [Verrucomicrobia bacterium]